MKSSMLSLDIIKGQIRSYRKARKSKRTRDPALNRVRAKRRAEFPEEVFWSALMTRSKSMKMLFPISVGICIKTKRSLKKKLIDNLGNILNVKKTLRLWINNRMLLMNHTIPKYVT